MTVLLFPNLYGSNLGWHETSANYIACLVPTASFPLRQCSQLVLSITYEHSKALSTCKVRNILSCHYAISSSCLFCFVVYQVVNKNTYYRALSAAANRTRKTDSQFSHSQLATSWFQSALKSELDEHGDQNLKRGQLGISFLCFLNVYRSPAVISPFPPDNPLGFMSLIDHYGDGVHSLVYTSTQVARLAALAVQLGRRNTLAVFCPSWQGKAVTNPNSCPKHTMDMQARIRLPVLW